MRMVKRVPLPMWIDVLVLSHQSALDRALAHRIEVDAAAVILHADDELGGFGLHRDDDLSLLGLLEFAPQPRQFDAVGDRITQHVLQRDGNPFQHVAIEVIAGTRHAQLQAGFLAGLGGGRTDHAAQARSGTAERRHAGLHQAFLEFGTDAGLLRQEPLGLAYGFLQHFVQVEQIAGRFGKGS
jgi:hypothetical protein